MGLIRFYSDFIDKLSDIATPFYDLTRKGTVFEWTVDLQTRFRIIQHQIINSTSLYKYYTKTFFPIKLKAIQIIPNYRHILNILMNGDNEHYKRKPNVEQQTPNT